MKKSGFLLIIIIGISLCLPPTTLKAEITNTEVSVGMEIGYLQPPVVVDAIGTDTGITSAEIDITGPVTNARVFASLNINNLTAETANLYFNIGYDGNGYTESGYFGLANNNYYANKAVFYYHAEIDLELKYSTIFDVIGTRPIGLGDFYLVLESINQGPPTVIDEFHKIGVGHYEFNGSYNLIAGTDYIITVNFPSNVSAGNLSSIEGSYFGNFTLEFDVPNQPPIIDSFTADPILGQPPLTVNFACTAHDPDGYITNYTINYGDGSLPETNDTGLFTKTYENVGNYQVTCTAADNNEEAATTSETQLVEVVHGYAIIVAGQDTWNLLPPKPSQKFAIDHAANNAYRTLRNLGFNDEHIFYLNSGSPQDVDGDGDDEVDAPALLSHFESVINQIKNKLDTNPVPLILYLVGHGEIEAGCQFIFDADNPFEGYLWGDDLQDMLNSFPPETTMLAVLGSCYSGCFITSDQSVSAPNRIIITGAHDDEVRRSVLGLGGWYHSSDRFWGNLNMGLNVRDAYLVNVWPGDISHLWLDDNGDSTGHPPDNLGDDGSLAYNTTMGVPGSDNLELVPWYSVWLHSPGELRVYDSQHRVTGMLDGNIMEEIPGSIYDEFEEVVAIFSFGDYRYEVVGAEDGTYSLDIASINGSEIIAFTAADINTAPGTVHQYVVDWETLSRGEKGVTLRIDSNGDGVFEQTMTLDQDLTKSEFITEQAVAILSFFDESVSDGSLLGYGPGSSADPRLNALRNMIEMAAGYIDNGLIEYASTQLQDVYNRCDSLPFPPDFVTGEAVDELVVMILYLMESLKYQ